MTSDRSNFELPIRFPLTPSKWLVAVVYLHYKMIYLPKTNPSELLLNDNDEWFIIDKNQGEKEGEMVPLVLLPESYVHTQLLVLMFRQGRRKNAVILTPDNISRTICRRLRVRLRFTLSGGR